MLPFESQSESVPTYLIVEAIIAACPQLHPAQARMAALNVQKVIDAALKGE